LLGFTEHAEEDGHRGRQLLDLTRLRRHAALHPLELVASLDIVADQLVDIPRLAVHLSPDRIPSDTEHRGAKVVFEETRHRGIVRDFCGDIHRNKLSDVTSIPMMRSRSRHTATIFGRLVGLASSGCPSPQPPSVVIDLPPQLESLPVAEPEVVKVKHERRLHLDNMVHHYSCGAFCLHVPTAGGALAALVGRGEPAAVCKPVEHAPATPTATLERDHDDHDPYARAYLAYHLAELLGCYERRLLVKPDLAGDMSLSIAVRDGRAAGTASGLDPEITACVEDVFRETDIGTIALEPVHEYRIRFCPAGTIALK
jgi:hypothetical protein